MLCMYVKYVCVRDVRCIMYVGLLCMYDMCVCYVCMDAIVVINVW